MARTKTRARRRASDDFVMQEVKSWIAKNPDPDGRLDVDAMVRSFMKNDAIPDTPASKFQRIKRRVCSAMTRHHEHDAELGSVRTIYPVRKDVQGQTFWEWAYGPMVHPDHVKTSLRQRYNSVEARIDRIENDRLYYNKTNKRGAEIAAFDYDFNRLRNESELAKLHGGDYPDEKPSN